jgi:hypothetical protein
MGSTDTYLGDRGINRSSMWSAIVCLSPATNSVYVLTPNKNYTLTNTPTTRCIATDYHFIEGTVPSSVLGPLKPVFRLETAVYAYLNPGSPLSHSLPPGKIIDLTGANAYDTLAPYITYASKTENDYAVNGEFYIVMLTKYIDTFTLKKYAVHLVNVTLHHISYDNDTSIEIGEPAWATAKLLYWNESEWLPLNDSTVYFYLRESLIPLGSNTTDSNRTAYLDLDDVARNPNVFTGTYYLEARYTPMLEFVRGYSGTNYIYSSVTNESTSNYTIIKESFVPSLPESPILPLLLILAVVTVILLKRQDTRD